MRKILSDLAILVSLVSFYLSGPDARFQRDIRRFKQERVNIRETGAFVEYVLQPQNSWLYTVTDY